MGCGSLCNILDTTHSLTPLSRPRSAPQYLVSGRMILLHQVISFTTFGNHLYTPGPDILIMNIKYWCADKGDLFEHIRNGGSCALVPCKQSDCERWTGDPARSCVYLVEARPRRT